jgi:hypothetical protein
VPAHVNQFTAAGLFPNGTSSARYDCTVAVGMMALDDFTGGAIRPTATAFRARQRDQSGGIGLNDVAVVWKSYGLPPFTSGSKGWGSIMDRLRAGRPVAMQGWSGALGRFAVGKAVAHAIYATRATPGGMIVIHDPLRNAAITIPESDVQRFYFSGFALAGWGTGAYAGRPATSPTSAPVAGVSAGLLDEWLARIGRRSSDPVRESDVAPFVMFLVEKGIVPRGGSSNPLVRAVEIEVRRAVGSPWSSVGARFLASAGTQDPFGLGGLSVGLGDAIGEGAFVLVVGGLIAVLFVLGAWRLTSR